jgi:CBS domain-containing protein
MQPCIRVGAIDSDRRLPVLNRDKGLVGIISLGDIAVMQDGPYAETTPSGIS